MRVLVLWAPLPDGLSVAPCRTAIEALGVGGHARPERCAAFQRRVAAVLGAW